MEPDAVRVLDAEGPPLELIDGRGGVAEAIIWPGTGAVLRSVHRFRLTPFGRTRPQCHPSEAVYYVVRGTASVLDPDDDESFELDAGSMVHVEPGTTYTFLSGNDGAEIVGGPCPADPSLYTHLSAKGSPE